MHNDGFLHNHWDPKMVASGSQNSASTYKKCGQSPTVKHATILGFNAMLLRSNATLFRLMPQFWEPNCITHVSSKYVMSIMLMYKS